MGCWPGDGCLSVFPKDLVSGSHISEAEPSMSAGDPVHPIQGFPDAGGYASPWPEFSVPVAALCGVLCTGGAEL